MPTRMTSEIDQTFQRGKSSISRSRAWTTGQHLAQRALDDADADALRDLDLGLVVGDLGHPAADAAAGDHFVALLDRGDRRLMLLHPLLLRTNHQHVEDHEDQEPRGNADEDCRSRCSGSHPPRRGSAGECLVIG